jgi:hypothetical protein
MQNVRDRITLGIALIVAVVGGMSGSLYVAFPLLLLAIFFIFWGASSSAREARPKVNEVTMRKVLLCVVILLAGAASMIIAPAKAIPQPKQRWNIGRGLVEKAGWHRYYRHHQYYSRRYSYYPPPYIFYPPPFPHYPRPYGYDLPYHYRYYPPY